MPPPPTDLSDRLVESVPNVSEGRRLEVVELIATAVSSVAGVHLLDRTSDPSHNRSVFTLVGEEKQLEDALVAGVATAKERIDLRRHEGAHPRIGAADV